MVLIGSSVTTDSTLMYVPQTHFSMYSQNTTCLVSNSPESSLTMTQQDVELPQTVSPELRKGYHTMSGLEGEGGGEVEGLLGEAAGAAAGAAPGRALSTPCKLANKQVNTGRECYRPRDRAVQGRVGQGRATASGITSGKDA